MATDNEQMGREDKDRPGADDEYMPEFTGEQPGGEFGADQPGRSFTPEGGVPAREGMNPIVRKLIFIAVAILAILALSLFLRYQEKSRLASQSEAKAEIPVPSATKTTTTTTTATPSKNIAEATTTTKKFEVVQPPEIVLPAGSAVPTSPAPVVQSSVPVLEAPTPVPTPTPTPMPVVVAPVEQNPPVPAISVGAEHVNKLNALATEVHGLSNSVTSLTQTVRTIENKLSGTAAPEAMLTSPIKVVTKTVVNNTPQKRNGVMVTTIKGPNTPFYIVAMLPGRAWINGPYGSSFTAAVGELIPGYGRVVNVDTNAGEVIVQGGLIVYGEDDR
ncbi:MAG: hypothetical protein M3R00_00970 [Pseudomonadota bacterium]|nr:hypothetical protein [Pseudomonadota bacterium]